MENKLSESSSLIFQVPKRPMQPFLFGIDRTTCGLFVTHCIYMRAATAAKVAKMVAEATMEPAPQAA